MKRERALVGYREKHGETERVWGISRRLAYIIQQALEKELEEFNRIGWYKGWQGGEKKQ